MIESLSICVPTFNRYRYLIRFYDSLKNQNINNIFNLKIELVIVDDGSNDGTKNLIDIWKKDNIFSINYFFQQNAGRSSALRKAIILAKMDYIMIMDDDCYFLKNFISSITKIKVNIDTDKKVAGYAFLRNNENGEIIGNLFKKNYLKTDLISVRSKYKKTGDFSEITKSNILKENLYKIYEGEKRMPTSVIWLNISKKNYYYYFINEANRVSVYLDEGISKNLRIHKIYSPNSTLYYFYLILNNNKIGIIYKINAIINFSRYLYSSNKVDKSFHFNKLDFFYKICIYFFLPIGFILLISDKIFIKKTNQKIR